MSTKDTTNDYLEGARIAYLEADEDTQEDIYNELVSEGYKTEAEEIKKEFNSIEKECEFCGGTGEVDSWGAVYQGEPHMALIGTKKCVCQFKDEDYND